MNEKTPRGLSKYRPSYQAINTWYLASLAQSSQVMCFTKAMQLTRSLWVSEGTEERCRKCNTPTHLPHGHVLN